MLKVAVIADDLTGAADTGVLFAPVVAEMRLLTAERFGARPDKSALSGVAISTDSRSMDSDRAGSWCLHASSKPGHRFFSGWLSQTGAARLCGCLLCSRSVHLRLCGPCV